MKRSKTITLDATFETELSNAMERKRSRFKIEKITVNFNP